LRKLAKGKIGVAVVTHDINFASLFCDKLLLLEEGLCLAQGPPEKVLSRGVIQKIYGKDVFLGKHPETGRKADEPKVRKPLLNQDNPSSGGR
jgi:iron complex transport system ATP-binding protein